MTKTKKFSILHFAVFMALLLSLVTVFAVGASAEEIGTETNTPVAEFVGKQVNLGGDISMKFYVRNNEDRPIESITVEVEFLGKLTYLTECEEHPTEDKVYIYTFEGIGPQCLGDLMNVTILVGGSPVGHEKAMLTGYSVEKNLNEIYDDCTEAQKQLIDDLRAYGKASEVYTGHTSMTGTNYPVREVEIPEASITTTDTADDVNLHTVKVRFGTMNYLMFKFEFASGAATNLGDKVKIDGEAPADAYIDGNYYVVISKPISPENFHKDVSLVYDESKLTLSYSINDYCRTVADGEYTEEMKSLAKALYNYGLSAHTYVDVHTGGEATCMHGKLCDVCGFEYGEKDATNHASDTYTYTDNGDGTHTKTHECGVTVGESEDHTLTYTANGNIITESCSVGCGYSKTATVIARDATYDGLEHNTATVGYSEGWKGGELTVSYANNTNAGTATASITIGEATATVDFTIEKATLTVTANDTTITYGAVPTNNGVAYSGFVNGENETVLGGELAYTYTYTQYGDVGNYLITPQGLTADNYEITFVDGTLTVNVKRVSEPIVTLDQISYQYDGNVKEPKVTSIVVDGRTLTEGIDYTVSYENNVYVGNYATVVINFMGNYDGTFKKWFTITQYPDTTEFDGEWVTVPKE